MNIDFAAVGGTAATVAGAAIFACKRYFNTLHMVRVYSTDTLMKMARLELEAQSSKNCATQYSPLSRRKPFDA